MSLKITRMRRIKVAKKKLYKIWQEVTCDSAVAAIVCAKSKEEAYNTNLGIEDWAKPKDVKVKEIGIANDNVKKGIIIISFVAKIDL